MNQLSEALNQQGMAHFDGDFEKSEEVRRPRDCPAAL